jgi:Tfp pilus assembly protein PilF
VKLSIALLVVALLAGCASMSGTTSTRALLRDDLFPPLTEPIHAEAIFRVSDEMKLFLRRDFPAQARGKGQAQGLYDALYDQRMLKLEYDATQTRSASEAFAARSGNCLSLVIMTSALAKTLGMDVYYQGVDVEDNWLRKGDMFFSSGHVNITLGRRRPHVREGFDNGDLLTVDFTPLSADAEQRPRRLDEATIIAMYMNNRAAEILTEGQPEQAYWWAREAILRDEKFLPAYLTLGVIYRRGGHALQAETVLRAVLAREPNNISALTNLMVVLQAAQHNEEVTAITKRLQQLMPYAPYHFFTIGQTAMRERNFLRAREMFAKEVNRQPYNHEFHFWLALAHLALDEREKAQRHLTVALDTSTTRAEQGLYAAKLHRLLSNERGTTRAKH